MGGYPPFFLQFDWPLLEPEAAMLVMLQVQREYFCVEILLNVFDVLI